MRFRMIASAIFLLAAMALSAASARAQSAVSGKPVASLPVELALTYNWAHSNAPPGGCGCFSLNGAGLQLAWPVGRKGFAFTADISVVDQPNALSTGNSLTLGTFLVGAQYRAAKADRRWQPFAEILAGGSHASGKMIASNPAASGATLNFAGEAGGGLDLRLSRHWLWRAVQADYMAGTVNNGSNNHQNILRVNTGVALRF
jgi:peptidoglycan-associated lipoprotein